MALSRRPAPPPRALLTASLRSRTNLTSRSTGNAHVKHQAPDPRGDVRSAGKQARIAGSGHGACRRHRRTRRHPPPQTGRLHHEPHPVAQGRYVRGGQAPVRRSRRVGTRPVRRDERARRSGLRPLHDRARRGTVRARPGPRLDRSGRGSVFRCARHRREGACAHPCLRGARRRQGAHPDQDRLDLGRNPGCERAATGGHRLQSDADVLERAGHRRGAGRCLPHFTLRRPDPGLAREGGRRPFTAETDPGVLFVRGVHDLYKAQGWPRSSWEPRSATSARSRRWPVAIG